jgi:hypothetical protein
MKQQLNYGTIVAAETLYPVIYTVRQDGDKVFKPQYLQGKDLTEPQIKYLYDSGYFSNSPSPLALTEKVGDVKWKVIGHNHQIADTGDVQELAEDWSTIADVADLLQEFYTTNKKGKDSGYGRELLQQIVNDVANAQRILFSGYTAKGEFSREQILINALQEIVNPIKFMRERLKEDERLDGTYAVMLSKDSHYLQQIAEKALASLPVSAGNKK